MTVQLDFAITNLAELMELVDLDLSPDAEHTFNPLEIDPAAAVIPAY